MIASALLTHLLSAVFGAAVLLAWRRYSSRREPRDVHLRTEQDALRSRLQLATDAAGIGWWESDLNAHSLYDVEIVANARFWELLGHPQPERPTAALFVKAMHPQDAEASRAAFLSALNDAKVERLTWRHRIIQASGAVRHVQRHVHFMRDASGRAHRVLGVLWDISAEAEHAEQLKRHSERAQSLLDRINVASRAGGFSLWELDLLTRKFIWAENRLRAFGLDQVPIEDYDVELTRLMDPDDLASVAATTRAAVAHGDENFSFRYRLIRDGVARHMQSYAHVLRDEAGRALRLIGATSDVTIEVQTHEMLQRQADHERHLLERLGIATRAAGITTWEIDLAARRFLWMENRIPALADSEHETGSTEAFAQFMHPEDRNVFVDTLRAALAAGSDHMSFRYRALTVQGGLLHIQSHARLLMENDKPVRALGVSWDVSREVEAAEQLQRQTQAAEAASRAKSAFLANMSHEIRTPMNGIIGMTGLLLDTQLNRTQRDYAETVRSSADSLLAIINDILDFSKIEAGKLDIETLDLDLRGIVEEVGAMMALQAAAKNLELIVHIHPETPDRVLGDPQRMRQCLLNLVGNAVKFTHRGEIVIEVHPVRGSERDMLHFEVRDTGIGVASHVLDALFQPFVQADSSTTRHFGGTGLGLSIVQRLVEMMGGQVGARSAPDAGSTFWFTLPLRQAASPPQRPRLPPHTGARALVVDDNDTNRRVLAGQLQHTGLEVDLAANGADALALLRQAAASRPFDLVLTDHHMPDTDGVALGERILADPALSNVRVIMLTSVDQQRDARRLAALGFAAYLTKPVRARELLECLDRVLACEARQWHMQTQPIITRGALSAVAPAGARCSVLLVEDNVVNQKVAVRYLERMGCTVRIADNGAEGVRAFEEGAAPDNTSPFDIVFMDLHMPVLDGLSATRRIRELANGRCTPIVALTANAMSGQLERCLEAGMNGFLTKPLQAAQLQEVLNRYGASETSCASDKQIRTDADAPVPVRTARMNELADGDAAFLEQLVEAFCTCGAQVLAELDAALVSFDRPALARAAHKLKGASANIHADKLSELAHALENETAGLDQPGLQRLVRELRAEFQRAAQFLRREIAADH